MSLEPIIKYTFKDKKLLEIALSHPNQKSFASDYQRFEFLGDSILSGCISKYLYNCFKDADDGSSNNTKKLSTKNRSAAKPKKRTRKPRVKKIKSDN